jgi:uncharacterized membrane protein
MKFKMLRLVGVIGGIFVIFLAFSEFMRTYRADEPKWKYVILIFGMAIILTLTIFRKRT